MKVVHLTDSLSRNAGGMFESVRGLADALEREGSSENRALGIADSFSAEDLSRWTVPAECFPSQRRGPVIFSRGLKEEIESRASSEATVFHLHGIWGGASRSLSLARAASSRRASFRTLVSPRGMLDPWAVRHHSWKKKLSWKAWDRRVVEGAVCLHALCREEAEAIRKFGLRNPVCVIPNGVSLPEDDDGKVSRKADQLLYLGRLHPKKGLEELLDAWTIAQPKLPDSASLVIAGWGEPRFEELLQERIAQGNLESSVRMVGPKHGREKARLYRSSGGFILPSHSEGLPMAVLEAWSYGLPSLITEGCHLPEGAAHGAALRISPEPRLLAESVEQFFSMPLEEREIMGRNAYQLVLDRFHWERIAESMLAVYRWIVEGGEPPDTLV